MHFDIETLRLFTFVVEDGSLSAAAERGHLTVSSVSKRVTDLEREAGTLLLRRHSRGIEPTAAGTALYQHAKAVLQHLQEIEKDMGEHRDGVRGLIRLSVNMTAMSHYLPRDLRDFLSRYPGVAIDLVEEVSDDVLQSVFAGSADLGICACVTLPSGLSSELYQTDELVLITPVGHRFANRKRIRFEETLEDDQVGMQDGASIHTLTSRAAQELGRPLKLAIRVTNFEAVRNMVSAGLGIAVIPTIALADSPHNDYVTIRLDEPWSERPLKIVFRDNASLSGPARLLLAQLATKAD